VTEIHRPVICLVTDRRRLHPDARTVAAELAALEAQLAEAIAAGVDLIQIRERDVPARDLRELVARVREPAAREGTAILVNDRMVVALAAGATGVHLRSDGPPVSRVRTLRAAWTIGRSIHEGDLPAACAGADYALFGTVFPSATKGPDRPGAGLDALRAAVRRAPCPVLAIGGITPEQAPAVMAAGAAGVAAIGVVLPAGRAASALGVRVAVAALRDRLAGSAVRPGGWS
jgi:thiamine-phosphate pyrophosphorylase